MSDESCNLVSISESLENFTEGPSKATQGDQSAVNHPPSRNQNKCLCRHGIKQFGNDKQQAILKMKEGDKSIKKMIDAPVLELSNLLNYATEDYYTSSSCSGRIIVIASALDHPKTQKKNLKWQEVHHEEITMIDQFMDRILAVDPTHYKAVTLRFEPFILHVRCSCLEASQKLLAIALASGYRNSGLVVSSIGRFTLAVRDCSFLEVPLARECRFIVNRDYLRDVCIEANAKLRQNLDKLQRFESELKKFVELSEDEERKESCVDSNKTQGECDGVKP